MSFKQTDWTSLLLKTLKHAENNPNKDITFYVTNQSLANLCEEALFTLSYEHEAAMRIHVEIATIH
jgi:hypothetical protein|tara:strand:+ start:1046 stop:1243 length:198 start_codon:yes stop_codon:yes gene_type:complete